MIIQAENPVSVKPMMNAGALLDIPTGTYITGEKGESILNGGIPSIIGTAGPGNSFKSTFIHYLSLTVADRYKYSDINCPIHTHDTEDNMIFNFPRLNKLATYMQYLTNEPLYDASVWSVISKSEMASDKWIEVVHKKILEKIKNKKEYIIYNGYVNRLNGDKIKLPKPNIIEIDSFSELEPETTEDIVLDGKINNSNTMFMQQGLFKAKVMKDLPRLANNSNTTFILTAHIGEEINMASGPFSPQPTKQLQHMKAGQKIKGVVGKILYLSSHFYLITYSNTLINQSTKMPEYPLEKEDNSTDLNIIKVKQLRSKTGPSGYVIEIVVSQVEGVLPSLTEFHYIKSDRFGFIGNMVNYSLALYPDVKLSRTKIRTLINKDKKLRRAINIQSELKQMKTFMRQYRNILCTPEELYEGIKEKGYDWDDILENTRGWYTPNNYKGDLKFLSTLDLLKMRAGTYTPFWYKKGK